MSLRGRKSDTVSFEDIDFPQRAYWMMVLNAARSIDAAAIIHSMDDASEEIPRALHNARADAAADAVNAWRFGHIKKASVADAGIEAQ